MSDSSGMVSSSSDGGVAQDVASTRPGVLSDNPSAPIDGTTDSATTDEYLVADDDDDNYEVDALEGNLVKRRDGPPAGKPRPMLGPRGSDGTTQRRLSKSDASSIVGGESFTPQKSQGKFNFNQKIFSFQLPFGNTLASIRTGLATQLHIPNLFKFSYNHDDLDITDDLKDDIRLKLERQESLNTLNEAAYFQHVKVRDDVRLRAVKHSLTNRYNDFIPDFIHNNQNQASYESIYSRIDGNIVIMGGYRGSILRDAVTHKRVWIPIKAGFNLRKINLLLGPNPEDEINASKYIYPDGVLKNIGPIDICKTLIKRLSNNPKTNVKEFGYDWRLNGDLLSDQLVNFLQNMLNETGKPTLVIAHSMGGLVAHGAMQKNPELFRSLIYVGVPSECLNILGPIRYGDSVLLADKILTAETNFMMRSSFHFLPLSGRAFYNKETNECYELDFFDPDTWVEFNLNPRVAKDRILMANATSKSSTAMETGSSFSSLNSIGSKLKAIRNRARSPIGNETATPASLNSMDQHTFAQPSGDGFSISFDQAYKYLSETLKTVKKWLLSLEYDPELESRYPPLAVVYGNTVPSVRGSHVNSWDDIRDGDYYNLFYGHGDGVVHHKFLMPATKGFKPYDSESGKGQIIGKFPSNAGHVNLMTDLKTMGRALDAVFEAEKIWIADEHKAASKGGLQLVNS